MPAPATEARIVEIYRETVGSLYGFVSRRAGGDRHLAEDITQEAWLRAVRDWRANGLPAAPLAWLMMVSRNLLLNHLRRSRPLPIDEVSPQAILAALESDQPVHAEAVARAVTVALDRLPDDQARLLDAFHFDRLRVARLAEVLGITERAVEGRLRRARERLRFGLETILPTIEGDSR
jgi:RNA polymerase sigma-70 factor (ECF subfamily)